MLDRILNTEPARIINAWSGKVQSRRPHFNTRFRKTVYPHDYPVFKVYKNKICMPPKSHFRCDRVYSFVLCHEISHSLRRGEFLHLFENHGAIFPKNKGWPEEEVIAEVCSIYMLEEWGRLDDEILSLCSKHVRHWLSRVEPGVTKDSIMNQVHTTLKRL